MPVSNYLLECWDQQSRVFLDNLAAIRIHPTKKAVHDIRVAVKTLKSIMRFIREAIPGPGEIPGFESIQLFFRSAGKYRDLDMSLSFLRKTGRTEKISIPGFRQELQALLRITRDQLTQVAAWPLEEELAQTGEQVRRRLELPEEEIREHTEKAVYRTLDETRPLQLKLPDAAHPVRKNLKRVQYWLQPCPVNTCFDERQMKQLDKILRALGRWQDQFVFVQKLRRFRKDYLVKGVPDHTAALKLQELTRLLQVQVLTEAGQRLQKLG